MRNLLYILIAILFIGCTTTNNKENEKIVKQLLNDFITAVEEKNFAEIESLTNNDFVIYENGLVWNMEQFSAKLEEYQRNNIGIKYKLKDIHFIIEQTPETKLDETLENKNKKNLSCFLFLFFLLLAPLFLIDKLIGKNLSHYLGKITRLNKKSCQKKYRKKIKKIIAQKEPEKLYALFKQIIAELYNEPIEKIQIFNQEKTQEKTNDFIKFMNKRSMLLFSQKNLYDKSNLDPQELQKLQEESLFWLDLLCKNKSKNKK